MDSRVTVLPRRNIAGWQGGTLDRPLTGKGRDAEFYAHVELREALTTQYEGDAHLQPFTISGVDEDLLPRINIPAFAILESAGYSAIKSAIFIDLDRAGHEPWEDLDEAEEALEDLEDAYPDAFCIYSTSKGARLVFLTDRELAIDEAEEWQNGLHTKLEGRVPEGLFIDQSSSERNRIFRAPFVVRDGRPTYDLPISFPETFKPIPVGGITPTVRSTMPTAAPPFPPTEVPPHDTRWLAAGLEDVAKLRVIPDDNENTPGRDVQLTTMVGTAARALENDPGAHVEIWNLLAPLVQRTHEAGSSIDLDTLWRKIVRFVTMERESPELPNGKRIFKPCGDIAADAEKMLPILVERFEGQLFRNEAGEVVELADGRLRGISLQRWRLMCSKAMALPAKSGFRPLPTYLAEASREEAALSLPVVRTVEQMPPVNGDGAPRLGPGLDKRGQLYIPTVKRFPSIMDPEKALDIWVELLAGYVDYQPKSGFASDEDLYGYIAWLCGCVVRPHLNALPVLIIDANVPGAGKTLLLDIAASVFEGGRSGGRPPDSDYKWDVDLLTWARAGKRFVWYDNVSGRFGSDSLNRIVTGGKIAGRNLHSLDHTGDFDFRACIALTANNIEVHYDTKRRALLVQLNKEYGFKAPKHFSTASKLEEVRARRGELFMALVSIVHGFKLIGMPKLRKLKRRAWASFEQFDQWCIGAVAHLTGKDPLANMRARVDATDPTLEALGRLLERMVKSRQFSGRFSAGDLKQFALARSEVAEDVCGLLDVPNLLNVTSNSLARALKANVGIACDGHRLGVVKRGRNSFFEIVDAPEEDNP